jgi:hypothetical protein
MSLFSLQTNKKRWQTGDFPVPWTDSRHSIYSCLRASQNRNEAVGDTVLPDDEAFNQGHSVRFVAGALDNFFGSGAEETQVVRQVGKLLQNPSGTQITALYQTLLERSVASWIDDAVPKIVQSAPDPARLAMFFGWLARNSPDREPVKFAIAMLGLITGSAHADMFLTFGAHAEFTKFASVALLTSLPPDHARVALFELARNLRGWGRIDLVRRLAPDGDADFRGWLVREGFRNSVMDEYLAYIAATDGQLLKQLSDKNARDDDALMDGAAGIFDALTICGGPAQDMCDYADGAPAVLRWFDLIDARPANLHRAFVTQSLERYVAQTEEPDNWPAEIARDIAKRAAQFIKRPEIRELVLGRLRSGSDPDFWQACAIAKQVGIDPWPYLFELQSANGAADHWYHLMLTNDPARVDQVIDLALQQLPLDEMATGPGEEMGLGLEYRHHQALDFIMQGLKPFPGKGWTLIAAGLQSPVPRNRNMAIKALDAWPKADWPTEAVPLVHQAIRSEPREDVKSRLEDLLGPESDR